MEYTNIEFLSHIISNNYTLFRYLPVPLSGDLLYLSIVAVFLMVKLSGILAEPIDPFVPLDSAVGLLTGVYIYRAADPDSSKNSKKVDLGLKTRTNCL